MTVSDQQIAVLVCDTPMEGVASKYGDFGDNLIELLEGTNKLPYKMARYEICTNDETVLKAEYARLEEAIADGAVKAIALTGGRADCFLTEVLWISRLSKFLKEVAFTSKTIPLVASCFGHQIIALNLGSSVGRNEDVGWECGLTEIDLNTEIFQLEQSPFTGTRSSLVLSEFHKDNVWTVPPPTSCGSTFIGIGSTDKCEIQGLITSSGPLRILTFQAHPEFHSDVSIHMIHRMHEEGIITPEEHKRYFGSFSRLQNEGKYAGDAFANFINASVSA